MTKPNDDVNILQGVWRVTSVYFNIYNEGWRLFKCYGRGNCVWKFGQTRRHLFPSGSIFYEGVMLERKKGNPLFETRYVYYPMDSTLFIDRSKYSSLVKTSISHDFHYRISRINKNEYWLYDLQNVEHEPEDYRLRIKIKKKKIL